MKKAKNNIRNYTMKKEYLDLIPNQKDRDSLEQSLKSWDDFEM